jgi:hypothetical protein
MPRGESVRKAIEELKYQSKPPIRESKEQKIDFIRSEIEYYKKVNDKVRLDLLSKMV